MPERRREQQPADLAVAIDEQRHAAGERGEEREHDGEDRDVHEGQVEPAVDCGLRPADVGRAGGNLHVAGDEADREQGQDREHEVRQRPPPVAGQFQLHEGQDAGDHRPGSAAAGAERARAGGTSSAATRMSTR